MEQIAATSTGMTDLMHAARTEARRVMDANKGDLVADHKALLDRLVDAKLITDGESKALLEIYKIGYEAGEGKGLAQKAYFTSRDMYNTLAATGKTSPVALIIASAAVGAYVVSQDSNGAVVVTVYRQSYAASGAAIGAGIGAFLGGPGGAVLGGEIGGVIGGIFDDKKGKGKT